MLYYDNQLIWQHTPADLIDFENAIISTFTYKNGYVFLAATDVDSANRESRSRVFCVDAYTGKIIKRYENLLTLARTFVDNNHLFFVRRGKGDIEWLNRIDANTLELETWEIKASLGEHGYRTASDYRVTASNNRFYFTQSLGVTQAQFGVIDSESKSLVFHHQFEKKRGALGNISTSDDRIYVWMQDQSLHIFEKT